MSNIMLMSKLLQNYTQNNNPQPKAASPEYYIVQPGDSLWKIAQMFEIGISELIAANPQIQDPNLIFPEQKITIPQRNIQEISLEEQVAVLTNKERTQRGLEPLKYNWEVARVARYKSEDMYKNNYFDHYSPTFGSPFDMLKSFGIKYSYAAENIAKGQKTAQSVVTAWMNSQGHRDNMLNKNFTDIGVGYVTGGGTPLWTQMFIRP